MPKISVLMPIYNTPIAFLKEAIESILSQTFTDFEFLILNDSPENKEIEEAVLSYQDERIKYSKNEQNLGITPSRNKLIEMSEGQYLAVMDHDDISLPTRFEKQVNVLDLHEKIGVVGCDADCFSGNPRKYPESDFAIKSSMTRKCAIVHPASMIRKSVLTENNIKYEEKYSPSEDYCLWIRLIPVTQFYNIQEVLFFYRDFDDNTSARQSEKMQKVTEILHKEFARKYRFTSFYIWFHLCRFFYQSKLKKSGKRVIKICKIPVYSRRAKS